MSCKELEILNPVSKKCVKLKSEVGKVILHYEKLAGLIDESSLEEEVDNSFYDIIKGKREGEGMTKFELLQYLSDLSLKSDECIKLKEKFPLLKSIEPTTNIDPIQYLLEECLNEQAQRGQLFETIWDIFIKLGFSKFGKDYYHILNNVNIERLEEQYLEDSKLPNGIKYIKYVDYFKKKCISGNSTGVSDISLKHKDIKINNAEACEDDSTTRVDIDINSDNSDIPDVKKEDTIYISCKYYLDDSKKRITDYDLQNILSLIKNKYKTEIDSGKELPDFTIYLFVKDKKKVIDVINNSNKSSEYLRKNIKLENIWDLDDLKEVYWNFYNFMNTFRKNNTLNENIFKIASGEITKPNLMLRFHQEYAIEKSLQNIGEHRGGYMDKETRKVISRFIRPKNNITQVWGMIPRSGKTYIAGGFLKEYSKRYTKEPCKALIITSAPTETKGQWMELFEFSDFKGWHVKFINIDTIDTLKSYDGKQNLVYIASKQYLDTNDKKKKLDDDETETPEFNDTKLQKLVELSEIIKFNVIIFDENHLGGTTELAKQTLDRFGENANKLLLTATFNKSIDGFGISPEHLITWDLTDLSLCKQLEDPRKLTELVQKHINDKELIIKILLNSYGINYDYYTENNSKTDNILENYYSIKGIEFMEQLYMSENAKQLWEDLNIYPEIKDVLANYGIDILNLKENSDNSEDIKVKCNEMCLALKENIEINNELMNEQRSKMNVFTETYKKFPDIHFIGLSFANEQLKKIMGDDYGFSMEAIFKTSSDFSRFENNDAIDKLLDQIAGGSLGVITEHNSPVPQHKSLYNSIRTISSKYGSRTLQDGHFTSQLWFIPFGGKHTKIKDVSKLLKRKLGYHGGFKDYDILSLYDEDLEDSKDIKQTIKSAEKVAKNNNKKGLIILSGSKLNVGISLKCVDMVFLMNDVQSYDTIYQSMFRALTESSNKKLGFIVDLNPIRMINAIYEYSDRTVIKKEAPLITIKKNIRNMLFYIDDHLFEYDDSIERSNKIMDIISSINNDNPNLTLNTIERKLGIALDNLNLSLDTMIYLKKLIDETKDSLLIEKGKQVRIGKLDEELVEQIKRGIEENNDNSENTKETSQNKSKIKKRSMNKIKDISLILIPFIKLFIILSIDDTDSRDLIAMYKYLTTTDMAPILIKKIQNWGVKDIKSFLTNFGIIIQTIYNSDQSDYIQSMLINLDSEIRKATENIQKTKGIKKDDDEYEDDEQNGGSKYKLSYILKNIQKINIGYKKFHATLVKLKICNNIEQTSNMYINNYLKKYDYLF
jgi:hypothetical protein